MEEEARRRGEARNERERSLESIASLASGIAHDFNNLFTVVSGNASLLRSQMPEDAEAAAMLRDIEHATERGRTLTDQMLTFSGQKVSHPELLDPGERVRTRPSGVGTGQLASDQHTRPDAQPHQHTGRLPAHEPGRAGNEDHPRLHVSIRQSTSEPGAHAPTGRSGHQ